MDEGDWTPHGFTWGPMTVDRLAAVDRSGGRYRVLRVSTGFQALDIYVSPTGRSVRVFRNNQELKVASEHGDRALPDPAVGDHPGPS